MKPININEILSRRTEQVTGVSMLSTDHEKIFKLALREIVEEVVLECSKRRTRAHILSVKDKIVW